jgi:hypothetical protein
MRRGSFAKRLGTSFFRYRRPMRDDWRYEPLDPARFRPGSGPFLVRGLAYVTALQWVDKRLDGGRAALVHALGGTADPSAAYLDQIFVVTGEYDLSPLLRLYVAASALEAVPVGRFIDTRARHSAASDTQGMWKSMLKQSTPEAMAQRLYFAFNRYFPGANAKTVEVAPTDEGGRFVGELSGLASCMDGLYVRSTEGFVGAALEIAGARDVRMEWADPAPEGEVQGIVTERVAFTATWKKG